MSHANMSSPFSAAIFTAIWTDYVENTEEYLIDADSVVMCPPPTSRDFLRKILPSLISNIMWHLISW